MSRGPFERAVSAHIALWGFPIKKRELLEGTTGNRGFPDVGHASGPPNIGLHATSQIFYYFLYFFEKGEDRGGPGVGVVLWIVADWPPASDGAKNIKIHFQYTAGRRIVGYVSYTFMVKRKSLWCERECSSCYRVMDKVYRPKILNSNIGPKVIC